MTEENKNLIKVVAKENKTTGELILSAEVCDIDAPFVNDIKQMVKYELTNAAIRISDRVDQIAKDNGLSKVEAVEKEDSPTIVDLMDQLPNELAKALAGALLETCDCDRCVQRRKEYDNENK